MGDSIGPCRVLGFTANEDAPPRMLHVRQLTRDGNHALLLLVKVIPAGANRGIFCCERTGEVGYNEESLVALTQMACDVVKDMGSDTVRPVWVVCGISEYQDSKQFLSVGQLTKQIPTGFKNYLLQSADLRASSYSVIDFDSEIQDRSGLQVARDSTWLISSMLACAEVDGVQKPDPKCAAFLLLRPDGRVAAKGYTSVVNDMAQLTTYVSQFNTKL